MDDRSIDQLIEQMEDSRPCKCWFKHQWSVWSKPYEFKTINHIDHYINCWLLKQKRVCLKCRKIQYRVAERLVG